MNGYLIKTHLICLLSDFSFKDYFVAAMKGSIYRENPSAMIVDITHDIPKYNILKGALVLRNVYRSFPDGTIFVAVVDPGVGSSRQPLIMRAGNHFFVGPDNGLLSLVLLEHSRADLFSIDIAALSPTISSTFHGRDIFAPIAAKLSMGIMPESLGSPFSDPVKLSFPRPKLYKNSILGKALCCDSFGNIQTNISARLLEGKNIKRVLFGGYCVFGISSCYEDGKDLDFTVLIDSSGFLEIASYKGSAAAKLENICDVDDLEIILEV